MRGTVTDRFDRNRHVLRLDIDVTFACMNALDAAARYLKELLPEVVGELEQWPSSTERSRPHFTASLFDLAEIDLLGHRVLLANVPTHAEQMPPSRLIRQVHRLAQKA
ncbi:hypothetical protein D3C81_1566710 [compost metagenome]